MRCLHCHGGPGNIMFIGRKMKTNWRRISVDEMEEMVSCVLYGTSRPMKDDVVVSEYGATKEVLVQLWKLLYPHLPSSSRAHHMLWWLFNCKHYPTKLLLEKALKVSAPTIRKAMKPFKKVFLKICG